MNSIAGSQSRTFLQLLQELRPHIGTDRSLPARLQTRLAKEKRFGSRDRRLYRELLYTAVRYWPWAEELRARSEAEMLAGIVWLASPTRGLAELREALAAPLGPTPARVADKAAILRATAPLFPDWVRDECVDATRSPNLDVLHARAPLWLRLQTEALEPVEEEFRQLGWTWSASSVLPSALELHGDVDVTRTRAFDQGLIEIQDLGSQLVLEAVGPTAGGRWLDACAGAGGKTLQLARLLGTAGRVTAHDVRTAALEELAVRMKRAGIQNVDIAHRPEGDFDGVLVDAPCTGTGTWRRSPHLKWLTGPVQIARAAELQRGLLARFAPQVRPGGQLVYATCSLCRSENQAVAERFLTEHPDFDAAGFARTFGAEQTGPGLTLWPALHNTDGFFVAAFRRRTR